MPHSSVDWRRIALTIDNNSRRAFLLCHSDVNPILFIGGPKKAGNMSKFLIHLDLLNCHDATNIWRPYALKVKAPQEWWARWQYKL